MRLIAPRKILPSHPSRLVVSSSPKLLLSCLQPFIFCSSVRALIIYLKGCQHQFGLADFHARASESTSPTTNGDVEFVSEK